MDRDDPAYAGQRDYNRLLLALYDRLVLGPIARFVWRCPSATILENYQANIRPGHLDVGPGTGWFVIHSGLPAGSSVTLLDANRTVLQHAARQLAGWTIASVEADVLKPLPLTGPFATAALNLVIHCLPGPPARKAQATRSIAAVLAPEGVLFGATVVGRSGHHGWLARRFLAAFNAEGSFDNLDDDVASIRGMLEASFERVEVREVGSIALFRAEGPRAPE